MEHIIVTDLGNGFVSLKPEEGYYLFSLALEREVSDAIVKQNQVSQFEARPIDNN